MWYLFYCVGCRYIITFTKLLTICQIVILEFFSPLLSSISPSLILGTVSSVIIFAFTYMCMHYLHHIHILPLSPLASPSHWCQIMWILSLMKSFCMFLNLPITVVDVDDVIFSPVEFSCIPCLLFSVFTLNTHCHSLS